MGEDAATPEASVPGAASPPTPPRPRPGCGRAAAWGCATPLVFGLLAALGVWYAGSIDAPPVADADLQLTLEALAPEDNVLTWVQQASAASSGGARLETWAAHARGAAAPDDPPWDGDAVAALLAANPALFAALEHAAACERAQPVSGRLYLAEGFPFLETRQALALWLIRAEARRRAGDVPGALADLQRHLAVARRIHAGPGPIIQHMVGTALVAQSLEALRHWAADPAVTPALCEQAADAVGACALGPDALVQSLRAEYQMAVAAIRDTAAGRPQGTPLADMRPGFWFHPNRTCALIAEDFRGFIAGATGATGAPAAPVTGPKGVWAWTVYVLTGNAGGKTLRLTVVPGLERTIRSRPLHDVQLVLTRVWLLALAQQRRTGQRPASLDALVGPHLPAVPRDPWDGRALRYDPQRDWIWCVGEDGVDGGGTDPSAPERGRASYWPGWPDPTLVVPR